MDCESDEGFAKRCMNDELRRISVSGALEPFDVGGSMAVFDLAVGGAAEPMLLLNALKSTAAADDDGVDDDVAGPAEQDTINIT